MQLTVEETDGIRVAGLTGELDAFAAQEFRGTIGVVSRGDHLVVDLGGLTFVDSAGLHALFALARAAREVGANVVFVLPPTNPCRRIVELVQLGEVSPIVDSLEEGRDSVPELEAWRRLRAERAG